MSEIPHKYYDQNVHASPFGRREPIPGSIEAIDENKREAYELLQQIAVETPDIPLHAIHGYFDSLGLTPPPLLAIDVNRSSLNLLEEIDASVAQHLKLAFVKGIYANAIDAAIVANNKLCPGSHKTAIAIHEMAHGTGFNAYRIVRENTQDFSYESSRTGYLVEASGTDSVRNYLLDEGRAELIARQFVAGYYPEKEAEIPTKSHGLLIPSSYKSRSLDGKKSMSDAAPAAIALELLITVRPELLPVIIEGPMSVEGLRETAKEIDDLMPGFYPQLGKVSYDVAEFAAVANTIIAKFYDGNELAPLIAHDYVKSIMKGTAAI